MEDIIECRICGKGLGFINNAHLTTHGTNTIEYKEKYGEDSLLSELTKHKMGKALEKGRDTMASEGYKPKYRSKAEIEIEEFLNELGIDKIYTSNQKLLGGIELDIVLPEYKVAIEYNGLVYHSDKHGSKGKYYHKNKSDLCANKGYRLLHIFEDDYKKNKRLIFSEVAKILGKNPYPYLNANDLAVREISGQQRNEFLIKHHIGGTDKGKISLGLFDQDILVSVICIRPYKGKGSENSWELGKFADHTRYNINGSLITFIQYFYDNYSPSLLYGSIDLSWHSEESNHFLDLGFNFDNLTVPNYQYLYKFREREHRFNYSKNVIKSKFPEVYSPEKTEWEMMQEAGYDRIWDCGRIRYVLEDPSNLYKENRLSLPEPDESLIDYMERVATNIDGRLLTKEEIERRKNFYEKNKPKTKTIEEVYVEKDDQNNLSVNKDFNIDSVKPIKNKKSSYSYDTVYSICQKYVYENASLRKLGEEFSISPPAVKRILEKSGVTILSIKRKYVGGRKAVAKRYEEKNKKKLQEKQKAYREENKEKLKDYRKKWYEENKESLLEKKKAEYASKKYGDS